MFREMPFYIFVRNAVILCFLFFIVSAVIIEHRRIKKGENSLFNSILIKKSKIRDYNNEDITDTKDGKELYQITHDYNIKDTLLQQSVRF